MVHATPILVADEQAEARSMLEELRRILVRRGQLDLTAPSRAMQAQGTPTCRRTLQRWFSGATTPKTVTPVEHLARAAGIDRAYLAPDTREALAVADIIRSAAAWWRRAAEQLEAGDLEGAGTSAQLGRFGLEGMNERIGELAGGR